MGFVPRESKKFFKLVIAGIYLTQRENSL